MPETPELLLERETELGQLDAVLARATSGNGCIALVHGEAGIGKTSLLRAFARRCSSRARFHWGGCEALFTPRPLGPLHDIAAAWPGRLAHALRADAPRVEIFATLLDDLRRGRRPARTSEFGSRGPGSITAFTSTKALPLTPGTS